MQTQIRELLSLAINAPSGDNSQPWTFKFIYSNKILLLNPRQIETQYNFQQRGSFVAHGALIENIVQAAGDLGLTCAIKLFPDHTQLAKIAEIEFFPSESKPSSFARYIALRATNRKPHNARQIPADYLESLKQLNNFEGIELKFVNAPQDIAELAAALSVNERLFLENRFIHAELFSTICWNENEMQSKKGGLFIKTLELRPEQQVLFKLLKNWRLLKILNLFGISRLIANDVKKLYRASAAYGLIFGADLEPETFVNTGRLLEKVWLKATELGLSLQPTTSLLYLFQRIQANQADKLNLEQIQIIKESNIIIAKKFQLPSGSVPSMLFRIGFAQPPSTFSLKKEPIFEQE